MSHVPPTGSSHSVARFERDTTIRAAAIAALAALLAAALTIGGTLLGGHQAAEVARETTQQQIDAQRQQQRDEFLLTQRRAVYGDALDLATDVENRARRVGSSVAGSPSSEAARVVACRAAVKGTSDDWNLMLSSLNRMKLIASREVSKAYQELVQRVMDYRGIAPFNRGLCRGVKRDRTDELEIPDARSKFLEAAREELGTS